MGQTVGSTTGVGPLSGTASENRMPPTAVSERTVDGLLKIQKQEYEEGSKYTQLILGLGYAAFFTVWAGTRDQLTKGQLVSSAALMTFSLAAYILFEISQMITRTTRLRRFTDAVMAAPNRVGAELQQYNAWQARSYKKVMTFWTIVLYATIIPAVVAVSILFYGFAVRLYNLALR
jgi:hypothetical protein